MPKNGVNTELLGELDLTKPAADPALWPLAPGVIFLNHGSFGSCPRPVLEFQAGLRERLERQPVEFFVRELEPLLDAAREALAQFVGAEPECLVFVPNSTAGVNTVLRSLRFGPGDELLVTNHEYNACRNALNFVAERTGAKVVVAELPFPFSKKEDLVAPVLEKVGPRTKLFLVDHVTSQTGVVFPVGDLVRLMEERGVDTLIDGAHAPGMVPLDLGSIRPAYYTGNCHKWVCSPKSAALLYVRKDRQEQIRPLSISHGANSPRGDRSRFLIEFGWTGTCDMTPALCVPRTLECVGSLLPGGWPAVMRRNRELALAARRTLCRELGITPPCPEEFIGSMAAVPIPDGPDSAPPKSPLYEDPLQDALRLEHGIEVPVIPWPRRPKRLLRVSAQLRNRLGQYEILARALVACLGAEKK